MLWCPDMVSRVTLGAVRCLRLTTLAKSQKGQEWSFALSQNISLSRSLARRGR